MRLPGFLCVMFLCLWSHSLLSQAYPDLDSVITRFFDRYSFEEEYPVRLRFAKKPKGWTVYEGSFLAPDTVVNEQIYWSSASKRFLPLGYKPANAYQRTRDFEVRRYLREYQTEVDLFDHTPFYGYTNWSRDVIQEFELNSEQKDNPLFLEGLAYAYWTEAVAEIRPTDPYIAGTDSTVGYGKMPSKAFKELRKGIQAALNAYKKIPDLDPDFLMKDSTPISSFLPSAYMKAAHLFRSVREDRWGKNMLNRANYPEEALADTRTMLDALNKEAFLFCWEENEIYPIWYLQQTEKEYASLKVIYLPLLDEAYYLEMLRKELPTFGFTASLDLFEDEQRQFVYLEDGDGQKPLQELISQAYSQDTTQQLRLVTEYYPYMPGREFRLEISEEDLMGASWLSLKEKREPFLKGKLEGNFLSRRTLILLDFLTAYRWKSPVHFLNVPEKELSFLKENLTTYGRTYLLEPGMKE